MKSASQTSHSADSRPARSRSHAVTSGIGKKSTKSRSQSHGAPKLELFQKEECPYSHVVRARLSELGLDYVSHTVPAKNDRKHKLLIEAGGKDQIPFLIDHRSGVKLYESDTILAYLEHEYGSEKKRAKPESTLLGRSLERALTQNFRKLRTRAEEISWRLNEARETVRGSIQFVRGVVLRAANRSRPEAASPQAHTSANAEVATP